MSIEKGPEYSFLVREKDKKLPFWQIKKVRILSSSYKKRSRNSCRLRKKRQNVAFWRIKRSEFFLGSIKKIQNYLKRSKPLLLYTRKATNYASFASMKVQICTWPHKIGPKTPAVFHLFREKQNVPFCT